MTKVKTAFFCTSCGAQQSKWMGKCPSCGEWNTLVEEVIQREEKRQGFTRSPEQRSGPRKISDVNFKLENRINTNDAELNRVLGGGLVPGSLVLIGGEPGIGKSTLMLQVALKCSGQKVLYISGEESDQQLRMRADRLGMENDNCFILTETNTQVIFQHLEQLQPGIVIIDSIQTLQTDIIEFRQAASARSRNVQAKCRNIPKLHIFPCS